MTPDAWITCEAAVGAPQDSSAHTLACVPGARRALTSKVLSPCQESTASGRTSTANCALLTEEDCANPPTAHSNVTTIILFSMIKRSPDYTQRFRRRNRNFQAAR